MMNAMLNHAVFLYYDLLAYRDGAVNCFGAILSGPIVAELMPTGGVPIGMVFTQADGTISHKIVPPETSLDQESALDKARRYAVAILEEDLETVEALAPSLLQHSGTGSVYDPNSLVILK